MLLLLHITAALSSLVLGGFTWLAPTTAKLRAAYGLIALTLASGSYLVWATHAPIMQSCLSGLIYLAIVLFETVAARRRLATVRQQTDES